ncbi:MAG: RNA polymerase sigma factor [Lentisphaerota bacterium]
MNIQTEDSFDDADVIRSVLDGAVDGFELIVHRHKAKIGRIVASRVRPEDVEDVAHQTFVQAFKSLSSFGGKAPFENWLSKLAVHCCYDYWRLKQRENERFARPGEDENYQIWIDRVSAINSDSDMADAAQLEETRLALEQAMVRLDADERWLLESHYYEGMPLKEAAATLRWSLVKTKVKAMRARYKLRKAIDELIMEWSK